MRSTTRVAVVLTFVAGLLISCSTAPSTGIGVLPELGETTDATTPTRSVFAVTDGNGCRTTSAAACAAGVVAPYALVKSE